MDVIASGLVAGSAAVMLTLGLLHLLYTFRGSRLHPREPELLVRMQKVSLVITRQTSMWKAWIGFNASHSFGLILFGLVYAYLALRQSALLFRSAFLLVLGFLFLAGYLFLGKRYWFSVPFRAVAVAATLYLLGLAVAVSA